VTIEEVDDDPALAMMENRLKETIDSQNQQIEEY